LESAHAVAESDQARTENEENRDFDGQRLGTRDKDVGIMRENLNLINFPSFLTLPSAMKTKSPRRIGEELFAKTRATRNSAGNRGSLVQRAVLLMLDDHPERIRFSVLDEVEKCILEALRLDPQHLDALEEAAHFYDVMAPDHTKATMFAQCYIQVVQKVIADMQTIIDESD